MPSHNLSPLKETNYSCSAILFFFFLLVLNVNVFFPPFAHFCALSINYKIYTYIMHSYIPQHIVFGLYDGSQLYVAVLPLLACAVKNKKKENKKTKEEEKLITPQKKTSKISHRTL